MRRAVQVLSIVLLAASCGGQPAAVELSAPPGNLSVSTAPPRSGGLTGASEPGASAEDHATTATTVPWESASIEGRAISPVVMPTRLVIEGLGIDAPIAALGVNSDGVMDVPDNVTDVAWYRFGASPGDPGSAVLAAHVDMANFGPGVFFDIDELRVGEEVVVAFDDESTRTFVVGASERVLKADLDVDELFAEEGPVVVRLVTCGGGFNPEIGHYDSNVIVTLLPAEGS